MDRLTSDQAQALFSAGGFLILTDLPESSEFGIDGTFHLTRRCSGVKFLPPGLHLITWSPPPSSTPRPSAIPLRSALLHVFKPKERVVLAYDEAFETVPIPSPSEGEVISDDHLKTLDNELAPYPFDGLEGWNALTSHISGDVVKDVLGASGRVDGIMQADGEEDEVSSKVVDGERVMRFPVYRLKRSWRDGAVGEEVTRYARDKSWLMGDVLTSSFESDPRKLLGHLELAFILMLNLSSYSALMVYKRLLTLFCRSSHILISASEYVEADNSDESVRRTFIELLGTLAAQLRSLPDSAFETELPEMDVFYLDELEALRNNLAAALGSWTDMEDSALREAWARPRAGAKEKWRWELEALAPRLEVEGEDEDEEGEYAPVVVEA